MTIFPPLPPMVYGITSVREEKRSYHYISYRHLKKIFRCYYEQFYGNTFENSDEMDKFFQ